MHSPLNEWVSDNGAAHFRAPCDSDFGTLAAIRRDLGMQALLLTVPEATDDDAIRAWIARRSQDAGGMFLVIAEMETDKALGFVQVSGVHRRNRHGYGGIALAGDVRSRGLGQSTLRFLVNFAATELGLAKLLSEVRTDNYAAIRMNLAVGYRITGTLQNHFCDGEGKFHDVLLFERQLPGADT